ncbi:MAG: sugar transferase [Candidatus Marinimicrobia bacterium]|nr:sugar transferase [Candidatus Neomarinimicrobiota bacterium]
MQTIEKPIAVLSLFILFPLMILICIGIIFTIGFPIFFKQKRPGINGIPFYFYKFRTMTNEKDNNGKLLPDEKRFNKFGDYLRKTSLDELPSFWNVLKGEMSLVGPRPLLMEYLDYYSPGQARRHEVKPGSTGWAQINGRNTISWDEKFKLDVWYVDNQSIWLDTKILFITAWKVLKREGISQKGHVTMERFRGSK